MPSISSKPLKNSLIDLAPEHMKIILRILKEYIPDATVVVFGSRINGNAKATSDIDIVIKNDSPLATRTLSALTDAFSESRLPIKVDIVEWATTNENFRKIIESKNVRIQ